MPVFQALNWESRDVDGEHLVSIFGRAEDGRSVCVTTTFKPYFFIKLAKNSTEASVRALWQKVSKFGPESYDILRSKDVWGFQNNEKFPFMKLNFATLEQMRKCDGKLRYPLQGDSHTVKVYESNLDPVLRFMHRSGIKSTGWLDTGENCSRANLSRCTIDLFCNDWKTLKPVERDDVAPFIVASFDIETYSSTGRFPDADISEDAVFQVAFTLKRQTEDDIYKRVCLCFKETEGINVRSFKTERDLLMATRDFILENDIDILTGWNIFGFDLEYLCKRAAINGCAEEFSHLGRLKDVTSGMTYKKLSSSALGDNMLKLLPMPGRFIFDLFHEVKREYKLDSYKLDHVSEIYLGDHKIDMSPKEMFVRYKKEDPKELGEVAAYCIKDTELPHRLIVKLCTLLNLLEMAKATWVPIHYLVERGQQIKVFSQICRKARDNGFMVPTIRWGKVAPEQYEGATVLEAQTGAYYVPITALDFEGLYPSIMMAHNLCYSSLVLDPAYDNLPGITYESFEIEGKVHRFAQGVPSLIPDILAELKAFRKQAKKDMASSTGQMKQVYNGKQLAYKVSMNSVYGFTGASRGILPCVPIAATVTCEGRHMIEQTKELVEREFKGAKVRYGDSVTPDTPLLVRVNGIVKTVRIDSLISEYQNRTDGKEIGFVNAEVWTEKGFTSIQQVVRHKTTKKIYRVLTHTGVVDVTEDHSLLLDDATKISPNKVTLNTKLLHGDCVQALVSSQDIVTPEEAKVMGFFYGDGSCGSYNGKNTWALNNSNLDYLYEMQGLCPFETKIYDTLDSSGVYKLNAVGNVKNISQRYGNLFYNTYKEKIVPVCILNGSDEVVRSFWEGYYMAVGETRLDNKGKEGAMGIYLLGRRLGFNVYLNTRSDELNVFRQTWTKSNFRKDPTAIKKIEYLGETDDYVYDLTTESHHFHVGPGELVVHNTDSVMVEFDTDGRTGQEALDYSWHLGEKAAEMCNALFKKPKNLELEKVYWPYILYSKKRYAAKLWTQGKDGRMKMDYIDVKGLQLVRRDNILYVREVCKEILDIILDSADTEPAKQVAQSRALELLGGKVPMSKLVLSQKLAESYKNENLAHVRVRDKMKEREPGSEPQSGDRVPYVLVKTEKKTATQGDRAEDPGWVVKHGLPLDYEYYFTNKFMNPVCDLLEPLVENPKQTIFGDLVKTKAKKKEGGDIVDIFNKYKQKAQ
jgi:DNA polymerase elongation subunit (family B)